MDKLLSVIVPVYNVEQYVDRCVSSIVNQTYRNLEIILVDDGSTDSSGKICDTWVQKDERVVVMHKTNGGVSSARNAALEVMSGEYVTFVDADDWLDQSTYKSVMENIFTCHAEAAIFGYCGVLLDGTVTNGMSQGNRVCINSNIAFEKCLCNAKHGGGFFTSMCNKIFHCSLLDDAGKKILLDTRLSVGEDEVWLYHVFKKDFQVVCDSSPYYHYCERAGSAIANRDLRTVNKQNIDSIQCHKIICNIVEQGEFEKTIKRLAKARMFFYTYKMYVNLYEIADKSLEADIQENFRRGFACYLMSDNYSFLGKVRVILVLMMIRCHLPNRMVDHVIKMRRR